MTSRDVARRIEVRYLWDPRAKAWAVVTDTPGLTTFGRTLAAAQVHAVDAVATWLELPDGQSLDVAGVYLDHVVVTPGVNPEELAGITRDREALGDLQAKVTLRTSVAVRTMQQAGLSMRDIGAALGISHQRVQQLASVRRGGHQTT